MTKPLWSAHWSEQVVRQLQALDAARFAALQVQYRAQLDSSNSELLRLAHAGHTAPQVLWVGTQTAGRGRLGRTWLALPTEEKNAVAADAELFPSSLCLSIGLPFAPRDWAGLSLVVGLALAESLGAEVGLKWPNDLWLRLASGAYAKLGGILLETMGLAGQDARWLVVGIGVNLQGLPTPPAGAAWHTPAVDVASALPLAQAQTILGQVPQWCANLCAAVVKKMLQFERVGFAPFAADFAARDVLLGQMVASHSQDLTAGSGEQGQALGVAADGSYQILQADGRVSRIHSAEISLRPVR